MSRYYDDGPRLRYRVWFHPKHRYWCVSASHDTDEPLQRRSPFIMATTYENALLRLAHRIKKYGAKANVHARHQ